jgi:hypothetical protein
MKMSMVFSQKHEKTIDLAGNYFVYQRKFPVAGQKMGDKHPLHEQ